MPFLPIPDFLFLFSESFFPSYFSPSLTVFCFSNLDKPRNNDFSSSWVIAFIMYKEVMILAKYFSVGQSATNKKWDFLW